MLRVVQARGGLRLAPEALDERRVAARTSARAPSPRRDG